MKHILLSSLLLLVPIYVAALDIAGISIPDEIFVDRKKLRLNGAGIREVSFLGFGIRAYVLGMYLEEPTSDVNKILSSPGPIELTMFFLRSVSADRLKDGWIESIEDNYPAHHKIALQVNRFKDAMQDVEQGDEVSFLLVDSVVELRVNGKQIIQAAGKDFQQAVLLIWLGKEPPGEELKQGILGKY